MYRRYYVVSKVVYERGSKNFRNVKVAERVVKDRAPVDAFIGAMWLVVVTLNITEIHVVLIYGFLKEKMRF